jgi:ATP-dependent helicase HrpA
VPAVQRLVELELHKELGWLQKELRAVGRFENLYRGLCSQEELQTLAHDHLRRHVLPQDLIPALTEKHFREALDQARGRLAGLGSTLIDLLEIIFKLRQEILHRYVPMAKTPVPATRTLTGLQQLSLSSQTERKPNVIEKELGELVPRNFLELIPFAQLGHLPRYLKALLIRAERASLNPAKDQEKAQRLAPYQAALARSRTGSLPSPTASQRLQEFRWMLEEFKVSLFAQELGTAFRISAQRLDEQLERIARSED